MKIIQMRGLNRSELEKNLEQKKAEAVRLRFEISSKQLKNNKKYRKAKKDIARTLTLLSEMRKKNKQ